MTAQPTNRVIPKRKRTHPPLVLLSGFFRESIAPMLELAREWGWELRGTWLSAAEYCADRPLAGALIRDLPTSPLAQQLRQRSCPVVRIGALPHPDDHLLPAVLPDLAASGRLAAEHFASRSFKKVAYVGYDPEDFGANTHAMYVAFREQAGELGMECRLLSLAKSDRKGEPDRQAQRMEDLVAWLDKLSKPVGVLCFNDIMAERVGLACTRAGLIVPEEVAILGYGNSLQCEIAAVKLSSVDPALERRVKVAMQLLRRLMHGEPAPDAPVMIHPAGIVERQSTHVLAVSDPVVAQALRFIWDHFDDKTLTINEIAADTGVCRRTLERKFRYCLDRGINAELKRKRLECCCKLLTRTDLTTEELAAQTGFSSGTYLHKVFAKAYGMPPGEYRLKN